MAPPRGYRLCLCDLCKDGTEQDPDTLETVKGYYLSLKLYKNHNRGREASLLQQETLEGTPQPDSIPAQREEKSHRDQSVELSLQTSEDPSYAEITLAEFKTLLDQHVSAFKFPHRLKFASLSSSPFPMEFPLSDPEQFALCRDRNSSSNDALVNFEEWLIEFYQAVNAVEIEHAPLLLRKQEHLISSIKEKQMEIHAFKAAQWEEQRIRLERRKIFEANVQSNSGPVFVSTENYLYRSYRFPGAQIVPILCLLLALALHLLCQLSRDRSNFVLRMLINILKQTLCLFGNSKQSQDRLLSSIPEDVRTVEKYLDLSPIVTRYVCCPKCRTLYSPEPQVSLSLESEDSHPAEISSVGEFCTFRDVSQGPACGAPLYKIRTFNDETKKIPHMVYWHQDLPTWLAKLICRPGIENKLRQPLETIPNSPKSVLRSIWDSPAISSFLGPDKKPFFRGKPKTRLPLLLGIGFDSFNPFHNKQAGKKTLVGAIFMFCHNLPESIRYLPQYIYLVGVINGPKQPSLTEINHYFEILINQLEVFFHRGYYLESTPESPSGLLVEGAVFPLIMDFHALRQATATASYNSRLFCIYCLLQFDCIDDVNPLKWPSWYSCEEHCSLAEAWLYAPTSAMREALFEKNCVRWSQFLRLPYFQVDLMCVIEPMHAIQNVCKNLVRMTWGVDHRKDSGDGLFVGARPKIAKVQPKELLNALNALQEQDTQKFLNARRGVLYRICEMRELRRTAKNASVLRDIIQIFYESMPDKLEEDIKLAQAGLSDDGTALIKLRTRLSSCSEANRTSDEIALERFSSPKLQALCEDLGIRFDSKLKKKVMAKALVAYHLQSPINISSLNLPMGKSVLGADAIKELNKDINRTILPSWISAGPNEFDSSQHGKLTAAEWRTTVIVRLAVTLPRLWTDGRKLEMLDNFMHLVGALVILSTRAVIVQPGPNKESTANVFRREYQAYLQGRVELYPTGKIQPTEHILYHIGDKLEYFGPLHPLSANIFERLNGMLQDIPTNMRSGDIEKTFMRVFGTGSNLRAFVDLLSPEEGSSSTLNKIINDVKSIFSSTFRIETGSSMLHDVLSFEDDRFFYPHKSDLLPQYRVKLNSRFQKVVWDFLESRYHISELGIKRLSHSSTWSLPKAQYRGIWYRRASDDKNGDESHKDSHVLVKAANGK